jgi:hypothetical protein
MSQVCCAIVFIKQLNNQLWIYDMTDKGHFILHYLKIIFMQLGPQLR